MKRLSCTYGNNEPLSSKPSERSAPLPFGRRQVKSRGSICRIEDFRKKVSSNLDLGFTVTKRRLGNCSKAPASGYPKSGGRTAENTIFRGAACSNWKAT